MADFNLQLQHGIFDNKQTDEFNRILRELVAYIDNVTSSLTPSQQSQVQQQATQLVNGLALPLIGGQTSQLATLGQSGAQVQDSQIVSVSAAKITGRLGTAQQYDQTLYSDLAALGGVVVANDSITVIDDLGHSIVIPVFA